MGCDYRGTRRQHAPSECGACQVERYIDHRIEAEGLNPALFDDAEVIAGRLATAGVMIEQVRAGAVGSAVFWRAVYGPAYPALVTA